LIQPGTESVSEVLNYEEFLSKKREIEEGEIDREEHII
jgi:hypothetical protein